MTKENEICVTDKISHDPCNTFNKNLTRIENDNADY